MAAALVRDVGHVSGVPLGVEPAAPEVQLWIDGQAMADAAPLELTFSDGERWRREPLPAQWSVSGGIGVAPFALALTLGPGLVGLATQWDVVRRGEWKLAAAAHALALIGGGYDLSFVPVYATRRRLGERVELVPFGAARVRWGRTPYELQGSSGDRSNPFARAVTRDLALAPMVGLAAVTRFAELRLTAGWELYLVDRLTWEERPTDFTRAGGPFALLALRLRLGSLR